MTGNKQVDILVHDLNHSGVSHASSALANYLARDRIDARLVVWCEEKESAFQLDKKVQLKFLGAKKPPSGFSKISYMVEVFLLILKYILEEKPKVIVCSSKESTLITVILRIFLNTNCKIIGINVTNTTAHINKKNNMVRSIYKTIYSTLLKKADFMIAISKGIADDLIDNFNVSKEKVYLAYPVLSSRFFAPKIDLKKNKKIKEILFVGTLNENKSPDLLIRTFENLAKEDKNIFLRIIGNGPLMEKLVQLAKELNLENKIIFEGYKTDILPYMQKANVLVMTSHFEGFGQVLAEAIACGTPAVSFDIPTGPSEIIIDGANGYLVKSRNEDELAEKITLTLNKEWNAEEISLTAQKFNPNQVIPKYIDVIKKALDN